jgi:site-specific DNA recombinase
MKAAIYVRQSVNHVEGIERGLAKCGALAALRDWTVEERHIFKDNEASATKATRSPKWLALLDAVKAGDIDVVIGVDLDRLVRKLKDLSDLIDLGAKVTLVDGDIDLTTADGQLRATMLAAVASFETKRKSERQLRGHEFRVSKGHPNSAGVRLFGFEQDGVTIVPEEALVVADLFEKFTKGAGVYTLARELTASGAPTGAGRGWSNTRVRETLTNPRYAGDIAYRGEVVPSSVVPALVSRETFDSAGAILADPTRRTTPGPSRRHLLSGLIACGVPAVDAVSASDGVPAVDAVPACDGMVKHMNHRYYCNKSYGHPSIKASTAEALVRQAVAAAIVHGGPSLIPTSTAGVSLGALVAEHDANERAQAQVLSERDEGLVTPTVARQRLIKLRDARLVLEGRIEAVRQETSAAGMLLGIYMGLVGETRLGDGRDASAMMERVRGAFDAESLDRQRETVRALLALQIGKGRHSNTVHVEHRLAVMLNADGDTGADDVGGTSASTPARVIARD